METIKIDILNPKAFKLLQSLAELELIKINKEQSKLEILNLVSKIRAKSKDEISLEDITQEVKIVRKARYEE